jgi:hypothetical protein
VPSGAGGGPRHSVIIGRPTHVTASAALRIICRRAPGLRPIRVELQVRVAARPDYIAADSGSDDVGPIPLGSDTSTSPLAWQTHDLEQMLLASRELAVPMIIGSAGDTGSNSRSTSTSDRQELARRTVFRSSGSATIRRSARTWEREPSRGSGHKA